MRRSKRRAICKARRKNRRILGDIIWSEINKEMNREIIALMNGTSTYNGSVKIEQEISH